MMMMRVQGAGFEGAESRVQGLRFSLGAFSYAPCSHLILTLFLTLGCGAAPTAAPRLPPSLYCRTNLALSCVPQTLAFA